MFGHRPEGRLSATFLTSPLAQLLTKLPVSRLFPLMMLLCLCASSHADTFIVNTTQDTNDGTCSAAANGCSLRDAVISANNNGATADTISFNIPTSDAGYNATTGVYTITLSNVYSYKQLPLLQPNTTIDGTTQTAIANSNTQGPEIELNGIALLDDAFSANTGFALANGNCTVKGLLMSGFRYPFYITSSNNTIQGCYIGTERTGTNESLKNYYQDPMFLNRTRIFEIGIYIYGGNGNISGNVVGGTTPGLGNTIAYAMTTGVGITNGATGNSVRGNSIFENGNQGISLSPNGYITNNDLGDGDSGANNLQNFPSVNSVKASGGSTEVKLSLNSRPSQTYNIDLYRLPTAQVDYLGYGEGRTYVGSSTITTDASGNGSVTMNVAGTFPSESFTSTATDSIGNTSEFSPSINGVSSGVVTNTANSGTGSLRAAIAYASAVPGSTISFNIPNTDSGFNGTTYNINLTESLLPVAANTTIDGTTQPGNSNSQGPEIQIYNTGFSASSSLIINSNSTVKGLILNGFQRPIAINGSNSTIQGCYIGTDPTGTASSPHNALDFGSYETGCAIYGDNNTIGGLGAGQANRIAFSTKYGVVVSRGTGNKIRGNAIFNNAALGIDLEVFSSQGATTNDAGDADTGPNNLQNYPSIVSVTSSGSNTVFELSLNSQPNQTYTIDVYNAGTGGAAGYGQARSYIGATTITTNANGDGTASLTVAGNFAASTAFSATTTDSGANTSEFSKFAVVGAKNPAIVTNTNDSGEGSLRAAINFANSYPGTTISFNIPTTDAGYGVGTSGVYTIRLASDLPYITADNTTINGSSQPGNTNTQGPEIEVTTNGQAYTAFYLRADHCSIKGLVLNGFRQAVNVGNSFNTIQGCYIGTDPTGTVASPNNGPENEFYDGININGTSNTIGGVAAGQGNRIAYASNIGVSVFGTGNSVRGNAIFAIGALGIDLGGTGLSANDNSDADTGANNLQNFPRITSVTTTGGNTTVNLTLQSIGSKAYSIDVYRQPITEANSSGYGNGKIYVGTTTINTAANGLGTGSLAVMGAFPNDCFSATATDPDGNTSEFSFVVQTGSSIGNVVKNTNDSGVSSLRMALNYANGHPGTTISFNIPTMDAGYNATTGVFTIKLENYLPDVVQDGTIIDGSSQPGNTNKQGPEIELVTNSLNIDTGFRLLNNNCVINGLLMNGFYNPIYITGSSNTVRGCYLGTDSTGLVASSQPANPYYGQGIYIMFGTDNIIGGIATGQGNRIAFLRGIGVGLTSTRNNSVRGNAIFANTDLGIDLGLNGVTPNDTGDTDEGTNNSQNYPVISSVNTVNNNTQVVLTLNSEANKTYAIDLYRSPLAQADPTGYGEGKSYVTTVNITTDASGNGTTTATLSGVIGSDVLTATATDPLNNTSEFSYAVGADATSPLEVVNTADDGRGSLRKALQFAATNPASTIRFKIPTSDAGYNSTTGVWTISILSQLPDVPAGTVIDGSTQTGNTNPKGPEIEVRGTTASIVDGFRLTGGNSKLKSLILNGFGNPIFLNSNSNTIESCYIGTDATGTAKFSNPNTQSSYHNGILVQHASNNTIGGDTAAKGNIIGFATTTYSGNGIWFTSLNNSNTVRNNTVRGNVGTGIWLSSPNSDNTIRDNVIRDNGGTGIMIDAGNGVSVRNTIRYNAIYNNGKLGIDIQNNGVSTNDNGETDSQLGFKDGNHGLNYPVLTEAITSGNNLTVNGTYNSRPNSTYEIDFFSNVTADSSGHGEGQTFLGTVSVTTNSSGNANFSKLFTNVSGNAISATATVINNSADSQFNGDTSEFSNCISLTSSVRLGSATYSVNESDTTVSISVVREGVLTNPLTVNYATVNGTAVAGSDYTAVSGTLSWAAGNGVSKTITVPIKGDVVDELDETFKLELSSPSAGIVLGAPSSAVVTIVDNDTASVSINDVSTLEGNSGTKPLDFTVSLSTPSDRAIQLKYATASLTEHLANPDVDYKGVGGDLTIPANTTSVKISVLIIGDKTVEPDETFWMTLSESPGVSIARRQGTGTILNDDVALSSVKLSAATYSVNESGTTANISVVRADALTGAMSVGYATTNGTATIGSDFTLTSGVLKWNDGDVSSRTISVPIINDNIDELDETFNVVLSAPDSITLLGTPSSAVVTIVDNDTSGLSINDVSTIEGDTGSKMLDFTVSLSNANSRNVSVNYATTNGTSNSATAGTDYTAVSGTLNFAAGETSKTISVPVITDKSVESDETFRVVLSNPTNATITRNTGTGTIQNDDVTPPSVKLGAATYSINENGTTANITVLRADSLVGAISVRYATNDGSAIAGSDYTATNGTLNWANGDGASKTISVPINDDNFDELDETFNISLSSPSTGTLLGSPNSAVVTIADNDTSSLSINDAFTPEGDTGTKMLNFTVSLSNPSNRSVSVNYATTSGVTNPATLGTDYTAVSGTLTFAAGETSKTISVPIISDKKAESLETFRVVLSNPTNATLARNTGIGTILDDDGKASVSISDVQVTEGDSGTTNATFSVKLQSAVGRVVSMDYSAVKGTATAGTDFVAVKGNLSFAIGETLKTLSVPVVGDTIDELDEQFSVKLAKPVNATLTDATGVATINDDDATPTVNVVGGSVLEGNKGKTSLNFVVTLNRASSRTIKVNYQTVAGKTSPATAKTDYVEIKPKSLSFAAGETSKNVVVTVNGDTVSESDERVGLLLSTPVNAVIGQGSAEGVIVNDDSTPPNNGGTDPIPTLSINDISIVEGNSGTKSAIFTVRVSSASNRNISFAFETEDGTAKKGSDYQKVSGNYTIAAGSTTQTISIPIQGDQVRESDEQFKVVISKSVNATIERSVGICTITNDDGPSTSISKS